MPNAPSDRHAQPPFSEGSIDVAANRRAVKYSRSEIAQRLFWGAVRPLFRYSPRPCFAWRRYLLRLCGATVGRDVHVYPTADIYFPWMLSLGDSCAVGEHAVIYNLGRVSLGRRTTVSQRAHLCAGTHDHTDPAFPLVRSSITVGDEVWVCADAFLGPGVTVGDGAIVGARAAVFKDVQPWQIVGGNPAKVLKSRKPAAGPEGSPSAAGITDVRDSHD